MENKDNSSESKDTTIEDLTKEDLLKKYKRLIVIAQKAKQSRDETVSELTHFKESEKKWKADLETMISTITEKQKQLAEVGNENSHLQKEYEKSQNKIADLIVENSAIQQTLNTLTQKLSKAEIDYSKNLENIEKQYLCEKSQLNEKYNNICSKLKATEEKFSCLDKTLIEFQDKYLKEKEKYGELLTILNEKIEKSNNGSKENLQTIEENEISEKLRETSDLLKEEKSNHDVAKEKIKFLESNSQDLLEKIKNIEEELICKNSENESLKLNKTNEEHFQKVIESLNQQLNSLRFENEKADLQFIEMQKKLELSHELSETLETKINEKIKEYEKFKTKSDACDGLTRLIKSSLHELKKSNDCLKENIFCSLQNVQYDFTQTNENVKTIIDHFVKRVINDNTEVLREMNIMNKELKERGELISKLEDEKQRLLLQISDLDKIKEQNEKLLAEIKSNEEEILRLKCTNENIPADLLSTSTISKVDESARILELEEGFEEKYTKLKILAGKLKIKCNNLQKELEKEKNNLIAERTDFQNKIQQFQNQIKSFTNLQNEYDKLVDSNEMEKKLIKDLKNQIEELNNLKGDAEKFKNEKASFEIIKQELTLQIKNLKKSVDLEKKRSIDFDNEKHKFENDIKIWEKRLEEECLRHKETLARLEDKTNEVKKRSLLNLEMADYEKTVEDLSKKLEIKENHIKDLEISLDAQRDLNKTLQESVRNLEGSIIKEQKMVDDVKQKLSLAQDELKRANEELADKLRKISNLEKAYEDIKLELDGRNLELAKIGRENLALEEAKVKIQDSSKKLVNKLEDTITQQNELFSQKLLELDELKKEFDNYKIRAQSVLKQKIGDATGNFNVQEEVQLLKCSLDSYKLRQEENLKRIQSLEDENKTLSEEKIRLFNRVQELQSNSNELRTEINELKINLQQEKQNNEEVVRLQKVQADTLAQCYKVEMEELEKQYSLKISDIQYELMQLKIKGSDERTHKLGNTAAFQPVRNPVQDSSREILDVLMLEREACEGSESIELVSPNVTVRGLIPLDQLLSGTEIPTGEIMDESAVDPANLALTLETYKNRIQHLTDLLSDAESDAARLQQLNQMLKEEIRRSERNEKREHHAHNLEYLKNVVVKFVTLPSGDERLRLVPVLNTILNLSPEELVGVNSAARGRPLTSEHPGWSSYLGLWNASQ